MIATPCTHAFALLRRFLLPAALLLGVAQVHAGLILHYKFDETSGTTAADSSGSGNTGTGSPGITDSDWTTGKVGGALAFNGSNDYFEIPYGSMPTGSTARTVSAWINQSSFGGGHRHAIVGWGITDNPGGQYFLIATSSGTGGNGLLYWGDMDQAGGGDFYGGTSLSTNTWYHVAATYDGASTKKLYLDGNLDGSGSGVLNTHPGAWPEVLNAPKVGVKPGFMAMGYFNGIIDDLRIYDHALSASEVSALAAYDPSNVPEPASVFASLGLLTAAGCGLREWRRRKKQV